MVKAKTDYFYLWEANVIFSYEISKDYRLFFLILQMNNVKGEQTITNEKKILCALYLCPTLQPC